MWERRAYNDGKPWLCTVKFVGSIPPWPHDLALGVEWDDPHRGRNNGETAGVKYFDCRVPGSGSFVKATRSCEKPRSFQTAVEERYTNHEKFEELQLSAAKRIETVGLDKLYKYQSQLEQLQSISVEGCLVNKFNPFNSEILERLDLSNNLLGSFSEIVENLHAFPKLQFLRLSGNRFLFDGQLRCSCESVRVLEMAYTLVTEEEIAQTVSAFPHVVNLSLAYNRLNVIPLNLPPQLEVLDLAGNNISDFTNMPPSVTTAYLSETAIHSVTPSDVAVPAKLDLRNTSALDWPSISCLGAKRVKELSLDNDAESRPFIIARCPELLKLDGTVITADERADSEMYTVTSVATKKHPALPNDVWAALTDKYPVPPTPPNRSIRGRLISFYIDHEPIPLWIVKDAPIHRMHWYVANHLKRKVTEFHIDGVTNTEDEAFSLTLEVGDLIQDGQHLTTLPMRS